MYNRYIPSADGSYRRQIVEKQKPQATHIPPPATPPTAVSVCTEERSRNPFAGLSLDSGDILVLLILLLVLMEGEDADPMSILITLAAFLILQ